MCGAKRHVRFVPIADITCVSKRSCLRCQRSRVPGATRCPPVGCRTSSIRLPCFYYFFLAIVLIRYETTATARWALLFIVRAFFDDTITVAVWTGFHVRLMEIIPHPATTIRWCFADRALAEAFAMEWRAVSQTCQSLWTIRLCEQFYTNSSLEFLGNRMVRNTKAKRPSVSI